MNLIHKFTGLRTSNKLLLLLLLGLILRFLSYYTHPYIHSDSVTYLSINHHDMNGELQSGLDLHRQLPPAILYFMRVFSYLGIDVEFGYRFTSIILYSFTIFPLFYIAKSFLSEKVALFTVFCYVCHPKLIGYSHAVLRESLSIPFIMLGIALILLSYAKKKLSYSVLAGLFISLSYMSRLEYGIAFILGLILFCSLLFLGLIKEAEPKKKHYLISVTLILTMLPVLFLVNIDMRRHKSNWDPFAYRKVKEFVLRAFRE